MWVCVTPFPLLALRFEVEVSKLLLASTALNHFIVPAKISWSSRRIVPRFLKTGKQSEALKR